MGPNVARREFYVELQDLHFIQEGRVGHFQRVVVSVFEVEKDFLAGEGREWEIRGDRVEVGF